MAGIWAAALFAAAPAGATPIQFEANFYELVLVANPFVGANNAWATAQGRNRWPVADIVELETLSLVEMLAVRGGSPGRSCVVGQRH